MVRSHRDGANTYMGSLRFEGDQFTFWDRNVAFVEVYSTLKIPRSGIPKVRVTFGYPRINGVERTLKAAHVYSNAEKSPQCTSVSVSGRSVVVDVGAMFVPEGRGLRESLKFQNE
jgi:hypothetical protein